MFVMKADKVKVNFIGRLMSYFSVFALFFISTILAASDTVEHYQSILSEINLLDARIAQQEWIIKNQDVMIACIKGSQSEECDDYVRNRMFYQDPLSMSYSVDGVEQRNETDSNNDFRYKQVGSYILLGLSIVTAIPGPFLEIYRNKKTYGVQKKRVLWSALLWPIASSIGNALYLAHLSVNQAESTKNRIINAAPATAILIPSIVTVISLIRYSIRNGIAKHF